MPYEPQGFAGEVALAPEMTPRDLSLCLAPSGDFLQVAQLDGAFPEFLVLGSHISDAQRVQTQEDMAMSPHLLKDFLLKSPALGDPACGVKEAENMQGERHSRSDVA